jgi:hypothetical protein
MLCTLAQFKERYGITAATDDDAITSILQGVSAQLGRAAGRVWYGRPCLEKGEITFEPASIPPFTEFLFLPAWPVVAVESVIETALGDWAGGTELTAGEDYYSLAGRGILVRLAGYWPAGPLTVQAVYTGGYTPPSESEEDEWVAGDGEILLPDDIRDAALQQAGFVWERRASLGLSGQSAGGGSISTYAEDKLLPGVREIMAGYRRMV